MSKSLPDKAPSEERAEKFRPGDRTKGESDRWIDRPDIRPCWRGDYREWHIEDGRHYQEQLYCRYWGEWVNPSGHTCLLCRQRTWPAVENWRAHVLPGLVKELGKGKAGDALVQAVARGSLTSREAIEVADEFELETTD